METNITSTTTSSAARPSRPPQSFGGASRTAGTSGPRSFRGPRPTGTGSRDARGGASRGPGGPRRDGSRGPRREERAPQEFEQKIIDMRRVTRVVAGGRRMSFSVVVALGDQKGRVGLGLGKSGDTATAISKATKDARKNMIKVRLTKKGSLSHHITGKHDASSVMMMPNKERGLVAGSVVRDLLTLLGAKDVTSKIISGSKNKLNNAKATMAAFELLKDMGRTPAKEEVVAEAQVEVAAESIKAI
jgi:small subunit ribosomal protein S5